MLTCPDVLSTGSKESEESWMKPVLDIARMKIDDSVEVYSEGEWWCFASSLLSLPLGALFPTASLEGCV